MKRAFRIVVSIIFLLCAMLACKQYVNPHVPAEMNPEALVAEMNSSAVSASGSFPARDNRIRLTLNNAPNAGQPLEQELAQQLVERFERVNPDIRVEYSTWQFTPDSFFERAKNRTLTDVIEVSAVQMPAIIDMNYATDITENIAGALSMQRLNPEALRQFAKGNRVFGVPTELHTMALFYNRNLLDQVLNPKKEEAKETKLPKPAKAEGKTSAPEAKKSDKERKKDTEEQDEKPRKRRESKGADEAPREFLEEPEIQLAQLFRRSRNPYYQQEEPTTPRERRGEQEVQDYFNTPAQQYDQYGRPIYYQQPGGRQQQRQPRQQQGSFYDYQQQQQYQEQYQEQPQPTPTRKRKGDTETTSSGKRSGEPLDEDILTSEAEAAMEQETTVTVKETVTTVVITQGMPEDWDAFIKLAVKLTDHERGIYGYAPVLFSHAGGREFSQWCVQAGLQIQVPNGSSAVLDVNTSTAAEVAQFVKDLRWRYDVMPPVEKCYSDNLVSMFAKGQIAMMMMPATQEMVATLLKQGMHIDAIGIAPLPSGISNRRHLTFGSGLIINTQLDRDKRAAAFKWLLFQLDPETRRLKQQYYFREQELVPGPQVPLYNAEMQKEYMESLKQMRNLPYFATYEETAASDLQLEPPYFTDRLYEALAHDVRPIIEEAASKPADMIRTVGADFQQKYLQPSPTHQGIDRYLQLLTKR